MTITYTPAPTVNAGPDETVCANNANTILNGMVSVATGGIWTSTGTGTFSPSSSDLNCTYTASAVDTAAGSVTLTLTTTGNGTCNTEFDELLLTYTPCLGIDDKLNSSIIVYPNPATDYFIIEGV